ncbi:hypothetical protein WOLCODRAFT_145267 [Wolfiporia cocos MD-104 SS10]|uniref:Uncharacterized protein n=1 Tax=Wolfiporia cocos (strain MD-104) TaxID=742152 RepID=A0A2H3JS39_WOLCO|nr:hypothetical protein WOLCODRAFT_145267 [Wolfiporia cocos MD-104 SS10]
MTIRIVAEVRALTSRDPGNRNPGSPDNFKTHRREKQATPSDDQEAVLIPVGRAFGLALLRSVAVMCADNCCAGKLPIIAGSAVGCGRDAYGGESG